MLKNFTPKEEKIMYDFIFGLSTKEIASLNNISHRTVETHLSNIRLKTNCHNRAELREYFRNSHGEQVIFEKHQSIMLFLQKMNLLSEEHNAAKFITVPPHFA